MDKRMKREIQDLIKSCADGNGHFNIEHVLAFYNYHAKNWNEELISLDQIRFIIEHLDEIGYVATPRPMGMKKKIWFTLSKKGASKEEPKKEETHKEEPKKNKTKQTNMTLPKALLLLALPSVGTPTKTQIKQAFVLTVKRAADNKGGYKADMDDIVQAKEFLLDYYKL